MVKKTDKEHSWCCYTSPAWGMFFVIIGVYLLALQFGFIPWDFPFWAIVLIIFGMYLLSKSRKQKL